MSTFVSKVMSLICHILSRFVIAFFPRSEHLLKQSLSAVTLEPKKRTSFTAPTVFPSVMKACHVVGSPVVQLVKNPPAMQETWVQSLGREDLLEKGLATHFSILWFPCWLS